MKRSIVVISSSSDDEDDDDNQSYSDEEELESENDSVYSESDDPEYIDDDDEVENSDEEQCFDDSDHNKVRHRQGSDDLLDLSHNECKEYLRKHQLRLSGTKEECLQRIKEHGRLKDGRGESLYPRSSFSINCTGDACKGDVVLFRQEVHKKQGNIVGKRTVAGRIVNESYGPSKQQHTFTVEVLWSKPNKSLPPLSALLVKGRNLYRFGTYRQAWKNEEERLKVLGEKHTRGDAARHIRKRRQTEFASNSDRLRHTQKRRQTEFASNNDKGGAARHTRKRRQTEFASKNDKVGKRQKLYNGEPSQAKHQTRTDKHNSAKRQGAAPVTKYATADNKAQNMKYKTFTQPKFHASSSSSFPYDRTPLSNLPPVGFPSFGVYNNGQPRLSNVPSQPPPYHHYNDGQTGPRHRFG